MIIFIIIIIIISLIITANSQFMVDLFRIVLFRNNSLLWSPNHHHHHHHPLHPHFPQPGGPDERPARPGDRPPEVLIMTVGKRLLNPVSMNGFMLITLGGCDGGFLNAECEIYLIRL